MKSNSRIQNLRRRAAESQGWRCFYCHYPMWEIEPKSFSTRFRVQGRAVLRFRCTAEHLEARCDGGLDTEENVVASCLYCNKNRHKRKRPKDAASYVIFVRSRLKRGRWHPVAIGEFLQSLIAWSWDGSLRGRGKYPCCNRAGTDFGRSEVTTTLRL